LIRTRRLQGSPEGNGQIADLGGKKSTLVDDENATALRQMKVVPDSFQPVQLEGDTSNGDNFAAGIM
jgi:hypothetical protein